MISNCAMVTLYGDGNHTFRQEYFTGTSDDKSLLASPDLLRLADHLHWALLGFQTQWVQAVMMEAAAALWRVCCSNPGKV